MIRSWPWACALAMTAAACSRAPSDAPPPRAAARPPPAAAASQPADPASQPAAAALSGEVRLRSGVSAALLRPTDVVYLTVRECADADCQTPGAFVAAQRHPRLALPLAFSIGPLDMVRPAPFLGPFFVEARVDRDGDAMTRTPDDLYATAAGVRPGQTGVVLAVAPPTAP